MTTYLDGILDGHRRRAEADDRSLGDLLAAAHEAAPTRDFAGALSRPGLSVIAEVKRRSPSKGPLRPDLDPPTLARAYGRGGAAALSVLTDADHFGGSADDLRAARRVVPLPVLRKDFTVGPADLCDARLMGADAALLIVAALDDRELADLTALGHDLGLAVLVEAHDAAEVDRALAAGARIIGVNQRNLTTFEVDHRLAVALADRLPASVTTVAESGVRHREDAEALAEAGYDAVLVGESLLVAEDPAEALAALHPSG